MTRTCRCRTRRRKQGLTGPLARWGFTVLAAAAVALGQLGPALVTGALAWLAWELHTSPRRRTRR
jgi:predicted short-subunit dehydrogenase-like oxidoreductase (DUF2520 family)